jgi:hypothetical protein
MVDKMAGLILALSAICIAQNTITIMDPPDIAALEISTAIGADDLPIIGYFDRVDGNLKVVKCGNARCSSGNTLTAADTAGYAGQYFSITVPADGLPVIGYFNGSKNDLKVMKCGNASCTSGNSFTTVDSSGFEVGLFPSVSVPSDGFPVLAYYELDPVDIVTYYVYLRVTKCGNESCTSGNTTTRVDSLGKMGQVNDYRTSIAVPADGHPVISYFDDIENDLKILKCGNAACTSGNTATTVDSIGFAGTFSSLSVPADGLPVVSYFGNALKVLKCGNASCSSGNTITTVDSARATLGGYTSLFLPADGLPVIGYRDMTYGDLRVAKCGNASCSSGNVITLVDTAGAVGRHASLAVPADGLPIISYSDDMRNLLKVLKCSLADCSATTSVPGHAPLRGQSPRATVWNGVFSLDLMSQGRVQVFDVQGNMRFDAGVPAPGRLEVPGFWKGVYFVRWISAAGTATQKVSILP